MAAYIKRIRCSCCGKLMTWAAQRVQYGRMLRRGLEAKRLQPRCQKCVTRYLRQPERASMNLWDLRLDDCIIGPSGTSYKVLRIIDRHALLETAYPCGDDGRNTLRVDKVALRAFRWEFKGEELNDNR